MTGERQEPDGSDWRRSVAEASPYLGLGMQLAFAMVFFVGVGYLLDTWLATTPWLTIVGAALGLVAVMTHIVRVSNSLSRSSATKNRHDAAG